jgi:hypothetical protein
MVDPNPSTLRSSLHPSEQWACGRKETSPRAPLRLSFVICAVCASAMLLANEVDAQQSEASVDEHRDAMNEADIVVYGRALPQIGIATSTSQGTVGYEDFSNRPVSRVGELAENVPGLIARSTLARARPISISSVGSTLITGRILQATSMAFRSICAAMATDRDI